uniref:Putative gustatory receptor 32a n=1 Tax=Lygus hesperus TaxID=30085 RepID=A0A0A9WBC7_LYGHE
MYVRPAISVKIVYLMFVQGLMVFITIFNMSFLVRECVNTIAKVDAFYRELFRLMRESKTLCSNKKLCLYVSMRKTVNFTACGFFNLGYPLITSIIAAATTYLVILVQFSIPKP